MSVAENLDALRRRIVRSCEISGRSREAVTLVAVSKTISTRQIREAYDCGLRVFGESRLQESLDKVAALPSDISWHFIGTLQSNKARRIAQQFDVIETVYKPAQLSEIAKAEREIDVLIEVNIADEPQKAGISLKDLDSTLVKLLDFPQVRFRGLMTVGPDLEDAEEMRPYFRAMSDANRRVGGEWLSMGMSKDFEVAIQEGASHIRIGTALFGARQSTEGENHG